MMIPARPRLKSNAMPQVEIINRAHRMRGIRNTNPNNIDPTITTTMPGNISLPGCNSRNFFQVHSGPIYVNNIPVINVIRENPITFPLRKDGKVGLNQSSFNRSKDKLANSIGWRRQPKLMVKEFIYSSRVPNCQ